AAWRRNRGEIALSLLRLRRVDGKIALPLRGFLRLATPVFDRRGRRQGVLTIDYRTAALFARFDSLSALSRRHVRVLNARGYWLLGAPPGQEWGFEMPDRTAFTLARTDPALWAEVAARAEGQAPYAGGWLTWHQIKPYVALGEKPQADAFIVVASELPA